MHWYDIPTLSGKMTNLCKLKLFFPDTFFPTEFKDQRILIDLKKLDRPKSNHITFNLAEHLPDYLNSSAPRFRISEMKVLFMDANETVLYHGSTYGAKNVVVQISFPKTFYDHSTNGKKIHFGVAKAYHCQSAYYNKSMTFSILSTYVSHYFKNPSFY